jgi:hypothetical protein
MGKTRSDNFLYMNHSVEEIDTKYDMRGVSLLTISYESVREWDDERAIAPSHSLVIRDRVRKWMPTSTR